MTGSFRLRIGIISVVIGGHFGGGDHFEGGDHFGGGTGPSRDQNRSAETLHFGHETTAPPRDHLKRV